jgi:predicted Zn finger-like uncharacterized protein
MILVTRCPDCHSAFRLTAAELYAHDGKVCCGQCTKQFDGFAALIVVPESQLQPATLPAPSEPDSPHPIVTKPVEETEDTFDHFDTRPASKISPYWLAANLCLLILLLGQVVHMYRTELSIALPATRPLLEGYCAWIQCEIGLPRHLALLSLESSDLHVNPSSSPEVVTLLATIRNHAPFPQQLPALLLTLTDSDEQPLASRILTTEDYLDPEADKTAFAANSEISIQCYLDTGELNAMGYRLELFYP